MSLIWLGSGKPWHHCIVKMTNLLKSENDYLRRDDHLKKSDFLWKGYRVKVIIFANMTGQKLFHLKRWTSKSYYLENMTRQKRISLKIWPCNRYYLLKSWDSQSNYFWKDDRVKVIIEGKGLKRCGTTSGPSQKYCKLVLIWYSVDINHTQGWDQYTKTVLSWI